MKPSFKISLIFLYLLKYFIIEKSIPMTCIIKVKRARWGIELCSFILMSLEEVGRDGAVNGPMPTWGTCIVTCVYQVHLFSLKSEKSKSCSAISSWGCTYHSSGPGVTGYSVSWELGEPYALPWKSPAPSRVSQGVFCRPLSSVWPGDTYYRVRFLGPVTDLRNQNLLRMGPRSLCFK